MRRPQADSRSGAAAITRRAGSPAPAAGGAARPALERVQVTLARLVPVRLEPFGFVARQQLGPAEVDVQLAGDPLRAVGGSLEHAWAERLAQARERLGERGARALGVRA